MLARILLQVSNPALAGLYLSPVSNPRLWITLLVCCLLLGFGASTYVALTLKAPNIPVENPSAQAKSSALRVLRSDETGLVLEVQVADWSVTPEAKDRGAWQRLTAAGFESLAMPGEPSLPVKSILIGVPPDARITYRILLDEQQPIAGKFSILPAQSPARSASLAPDDLKPGEWQIAPEAAVYEQVDLYPASVVNLNADAWLRDQRVARIQVYPFQYRPAASQLVLHQRLRIEIKFERPAGTQPSPATSNAPDVFEPVLKGLLLNYEEARHWRRSPDRPAAHQTGRAADLTSRLKIAVTRDGVYRLTPADLQAAGWNVAAIDPRTFRLTSQGEDVAIEVRGEADGQFDPGDAILFYGQKLSGRRLAALYADEDQWWLTYGSWQPQFTATMIEKYTTENIYWLTYGGTPGPRISSYSGAPGGSAPTPDHYMAVARAEQQKIWWSYHLTGEDTWVWNSILSTSIATGTYTVTLNNAAASVPSATVRAEMIAFTHNPSAQPDHHTQFWLNTLTAPIDDAYWDGLIRYHLETTAPVSALISGTNTLSMTVLKQPSMSSDRLYFDWFEIEYPRRFVAEQGELAFSADEVGARRYALSGFVTETVHVLDVSDPLRPARVLSASITSANGLYSPTFEISATTPVTFFVAAENAVRTPTRLELYTPPDLSGGAGADYIVITHRNFITAAHTLADYRASRGLRTAVIDVADLFNEFNFGIYHPRAIKNFLQYAYDNWLPPRPTYVVLMGDGTFDPANFSGTTFPTFMPPNLAFADPWQGEVDSSNLLVTLAGNDPLPDMLVGRIPVNTLAEANVVVNKIINYEQAPSGQSWQRRWAMVADNVPDGAGDFVGLSNFLVRDFLPGTYAADKIYANDLGCPPSTGACPQVNYALTSTLNVTGALLVNYIGHAARERWAAEKIFITPNLATLTNSGQLPVILSMTCLDGFWNFHTASGLMEDTLRAPNGGIVSSWSPTGLGVASGHDSLERGFFKAVFQDGVQELGKAALAGKVLLYSTGANFDLLHTFTILGDPALRLPTYALAASPATAARTGTPGKVVTYTLNLTNLAFLTDTVTFAFAGNNWPAAADPVMILAQQSRQAVVSVTVPITAALNATDRVTVTIQSHGDATRATAVLTTTAGVLHAVAVSSQQPAQSGDPGALVTYTVRVENTGNVTDQFNLSTGGHNWPTTLSTPSVILPSLAATTVDVTVAVPPMVLAGSTDQALITATAVGSTASHSTPLTTTANAVYGVSLAPSSAVLLGDPNQTVTYTLRLTNTGNITTSFSLTSFGGSWPVTVTPGSLGPLAAFNGADVMLAASFPPAAAGSQTVTITATAQGGGQPTGVSHVVLRVPEVRLYLPAVRR